VPPPPPPPPPPFVIRGGPEGEAAGDGGVVTGGDELGATLPSADAVAQRAAARPGSAQGYYGVHAALMASARQPVSAAVPSTSGASDGNNNNNSTGGSYASRHAASRARIAAVVRTEAAEVSSGEHWEALLAPAGGVHVTDGAAGEPPHPPLSESAEVTWQVRTSVRRASAASDGPADKSPGADAAAGGPSSPPLAAAPAAAAAGGASGSEAEQQEAEEEAEGAGSEEADDEPPFVPRWPTAPAGLRPRGSDCGDSCGDASGSGWPGASSGATSSALPPAERMRAWGSLDGGSYRGSGLSASSGGGAEASLHLAPAARRAAAVAARALADVLIIDDEDRQSGEAEEVEEAAHLRSFSASEASGTLYATAGGGSTFFGATGGSAAGRGEEFSDAEGGELSVSGDEGDGGDAAGAPDPERASYLRQAVALQRAGCINFIGAPAFERVYALLKDASDASDGMDLSALAALVFGVIPIAQADVLPMLYKLLYFEAQMEAAGG
jgi:hypothetical protein